MFSIIMRRVPLMDSLMQQTRLALPTSSAIGTIDLGNGLDSIMKFDGGSSQKKFSTSRVACMPFEKNMNPKNWPRYNKVVFPPQVLEEKRRPSYVCHMKNNIKYPHWKMWYIACLIRGMTIDEAIRQLDYINKKGAHFVKQTLMEAKELAVQEHSVEFRSNLWVAESFCNKGVVIKGIRRHARRRVGLVEYFHCHYFVRLEEGTPPKDYYLPMPDGPTLLQKWISDRRAERVYGSI